MIFGLEDVIVLSRTAARKSLELAALSYSERTAVNGLTAAMLLRDLNRIHLMADVASDGFDGLDERLPSIDEEDDVPENILRRYILSLGEAERGDELEYHRLYPRLMAAMPMIREGYALADVISAGDSPIGDVRANTLVLLRGALLGIYEGSAALRLPEDAVDSAKVLIVMCSELLRVHSGRPLTGVEVSQLLAAVGMFDRAGLERTVSPHLDDRSVSLLLAFLEDLDLYKAVLCAKVISDSQMVPDEES